MYFVAESVREFTYVSKEWFLCFIEEIKLERDLFPQLYLKALAGSLIPAGNEILGNSLKSCSLLEIDDI